MARWLIGGGVAAVLVGLGFICPAVAEWRVQGVLAVVNLLLLAFGIVLTLGGAGSVIQGVRGVRH